jgi:phosphatidylglycerophosphate synthase
MTMNLGQMERTLRIIAGLVLVALVFVGPKTPWVWFGLILIGTGAIRFCPIYRLLGLSTCPIGERK